MAKTSTYLEFPGTTEGAFRFYAGVLGTALSEVHRIGIREANHGVRRYL